MDSSDKTQELDFAKIGRRVRERRLQLGLSTQDLADRTGISRGTIVRVEAGKPCKKETLRTLQHVMNLFTDYMLRDDPAFDFCVQHRPEQRRWMVARKKAGYQKHGEISDPVHEDDPRERLRLGRLGFQPFFTCVLNASLPDGIMDQGLMEIYHDTWVDSHPGEEFVYCLRGRARIIVRDQEFLLEEGGAITFGASEPHQYKPAEPIGPNDQPLLLLIVVAMQKGDRTRDLATTAPGDMPARPFVVQPTGARSE